MAKKGGTRALKRVAAPRSWKVHRKEATWIIKPRPGPHATEKSVALLVLVRDLLGLAETSREARYIIKSGKVKIDGKVRKDEKFPVGLMDSISIPTLGKYYRMVYDGLGRLHPIEIQRNEANKKLVRVNGKKMVKGGKIQLNLHDGRNILTDDKTISVGDSLLIKLPYQEIEKVIKLDKGNLAYITGGQHTGELAEIDGITPGTITRPALVLLKRENEQFLTRKDYVFVVGEKSPAITVIGEDNDQGQNQS